MTDLLQFRTYSDYRAHCDATGETPVGIRTFARARIDARDSQDDSDQKAVMAFIGTAPWNRAINGSPRLKACTKRLAMASHSETKGPVYQSMLASLVRGVVVALDKESIEVPAGVRRFSQRTFF